MAGRESGPLLVVRTWRGLAHGDRDRLFDLRAGFLAPLLELLRLSPSFCCDLLAGNFETIAPERRRAKGRIDISGIIVFAMTAETEQRRHDQLRPPSGPGAV